MRAEEVNETELGELSAGSGLISLELAAFLNPSIGNAQSLLPPPNFPSLAEIVRLPDAIRIEDIKTMRGRQSAGEGGTTYSLFSPRGFSEFFVLHLRARGGVPITIVMNPFTGVADQYNEYREFEWTYDKKKQAEE